MYVFVPTQRMPVREQPLVLGLGDPRFFIPSPDDAPETFEEELVRFRARSPELLLGALGRPLYDHGGAGAGAFDNPAAREAMLAKGGDAAALLVEHPMEFADRLASVLERYWEESFAAEWARIEPLLARSIVEAGRLLASVGIWPVLGRLPAHCRVDPELRELQIDLPHEHAVEVSAANPLVLSPSVFVWPHLRVNCDPPWPLSLVYAAPALVREAGPRIPPAELLRILRALADDTRLRVLRLIAERSRTTRSSSHSSASPAQVSRRASCASRRRVSSPRGGTATTSSTRWRPTGSTCFRPPSTASSSRIDPPFDATGPPRYSLAAIFGPPPRLLLAVKGVQSVSWLVAPTFRASALLHALIA